MQSLRWSARAEIEGGLSGVSGWKFCKLEEKLSVRGAIAAGRRCFRGEFTLLFGCRFGEHLHWTDASSAAYFPFALGCKFPCGPLPCSRLARLLEDASCDIATSGRRHSFPWRPYGLTCSCPCRLFLLSSLPIIVMTKATFAGCAATQDVPSHVVSVG